MNINFKMVITQDKNYDIKIYFIPRISDLFSFSVILFYSCYFSFFLFCTKTIGFRFFFIVQSYFNLLS
jgi:hypothetical protein